MVRTLPEKLIAPDDLCAAIWPPVPVTVMVPAEEHPRLLARQIPS